MKALFGMGAILFAILGLGSGLTDWALSNFFLEDVNWEGPMVTVQIITWLGAHICYAIAIVLAAAAAMAPTGNGTPGSGSQT